MKIAKTLSRTALLYLSLVASQSIAQILVDDFNDGTDDGWSHLSTFSESGLGSAVFDASSKAYRLGSTGEVHNLESARDSGFVAAIWDASSDPLYSNGLLRTKFQINESATNFGLVLRGNADDLTNRHALKVSVRY